MLFILVFVYFLVFIYLIVYSKKISLKDRVLSFLIVLMTTGFVYMSSILILLFLLRDSLLGKLPSNSQFIKVFLFCFIITITTFFWNNFEVNFLEYLQTIILGSLVILIRRRDFNYTKSVCLGFFIGSVIIVANVLISEFILNSLTQETFKLFSISKTYNYTVYFLFFGLIVSPDFLFKKLYFKTLCFIVFFISSFILQSRSGFTLGLLFFTFLSIKIKIDFKSIFTLSAFSIAIFFILNSSLIDKNNPNDILYSTLNLESNTSNLERFRMVIESFEMLEKEPYGAGLGNASFLLERLRIYHPHAHNVMANWIYELGYIGIVLYVLFIFFILKAIRIKQLNKEHKFKITIVIYLIVMSQLDSLQYNILVSLITYFAISLAYSNNEKLVSNNQATSLKNV